MADDLERQADDVPFGPLGRIFGLRVVSPESEGDERLEWSARANMMQGLRGVGGRLYLTESRLVFGRNKFDSRTGGKEWSADLADLVSATKAGWRKMDVELADGSTVRFVVSSPGEAAEAVNRAVLAAKR